MAYVKGFNANGIAITPDGGTLIVVQANTGLLFRIDVARRAVTAIELAGATVPGGDGLVLDGAKLYMVQSGADQVAVAELAATTRAVPSPATSPTTACRAPPRPPTSATASSLRTPSSPRCRPAPRRPSR